MAQRTALRYCTVRIRISGLRHSFAPRRKKKLASTGDTTIENSSAPNNANATVQAIGLNRRPSTRCSVKMGM